MSNRQRGLIWNRLCQTCWFPLIAGQPVVCKRADDTMCFDLSCLLLLVFSEGSWRRRILVKLFPYGWCKDVLTVLQASVQYMAKSCVVSLHRLLVGGCRDGPDCLVSQFISIVTDAFDKILVEIQQVVSQWGKWLVLGRREIPNLWTQSESVFGRFVVCTGGVDLGLWLPLVNELAVGILQGVVEGFECNHKRRNSPL